MVVVSSAEAESVARQGEAQAWRNGDVNGARIEDAIDGCEDPKRGGPKRLPACEAMGFHGFRGTNLRHGHDLVHERPPDDGMGLHLACVGDIYKESGGVSYFI